jgi:CubicO group peptidase (beta-lactamase class C family)
MKIVVVALLCVVGAGAQERYIGSVYKAIAAGNLQSLSAAVIVDGRVRHLIVKGYANRWARVRATSETVYPFGAITQTVTAAAVAKLASEKKIRLDDALERHLGGVRIKGQEPMVPVTVRHVLAHAASLVDSREPLDMHRGLAPSVPAALLLSNVLFAGKRPLTEVRYSHIGYAALGLLITGKVGRTLPEYFRETWFEPLAMRSTGFNASGQTQERVAMGYTRPVEGEPLPMEMFYHSPSSPMLGADGLSGTAGDLARWVAMHLNGGKAAGQQLLDTSALGEAHKVQFPQLKGKKVPPQSLFGNDEAGWALGWIAVPCDGDPCIAHTGTSPGYTAVVAGNLTRKTGVAIVTNSDSAQRTLIDLAFELLRVAKSESAESNGS